MNYTYFGFKLSNSMQVTFTIENIKKITKYENSPNFKFCSHFKQWYFSFKNCKVEEE